LAKQKKKLQLFEKSIAKEIELNIRENSYFYTRGGWIAKVIYVNNPTQKCFAIHNPNTPYEVGPVAHELKTGFATPLFSIFEPPAFSGHPADLVKEVVPS